MIYFRVFIFKGSDFLIKRIIFDIDMTLLDTYKDCMDTYNEMYNDENIAKVDNSGKGLFILLLKYVQ